MMLARISRYILFRLLGWKQIGQLPDEKKYLIVVAPHTSNWDFPVGVLFRKQAKGFDPKYVAKKELFIFPLGYFFRWLGGYPVERSKNTNFVDGVVKLYDEKESFITTITPEGTRSYNPNWKSGFYYIAQKANIPILRIAMDYGKKQIVIDDLYYIHGSVEETIVEFKQFFSKYKGKHPNKGVKWPE